MTLDVFTNPALLKLDLFCRGAHVDDSVLADDAGRPVRRTRAGLGSGLEVVIAGRHWANVPVSEDFTRSSPYVFRVRGGRLVLERDGHSVSDVRLAPRPGWYERRTSSGREMSRVGLLQGTYLGIYPTSVCEFWRGDKRNCHFCSVGLNLGADDADEKSVSEVAEVASAAVRDSGVTYVDFNTGHYDGDTYLDRLSPYLERVKRETGVLLGVQTPPHRDLERYWALRRAGVNRVSFCFEIFDEDRFKEVCPGKSKEYGLERYLEAIWWNAKMGREAMSGTAPDGTPLAHQPWVVNGEIIAGLEPVASTLSAIDWITSVGAIPTVCVFRPLRGTDYENVAPPRTEDMIPIFQRLWESCMRRGLPIGVAPNVNVSLVLLPEECGLLVPRRWRYAGRELKRRALRFGYGRRFYRDRARVLAANRPH